MARHLTRYHAPTRKCTSPVNDQVAGIGQMVVPGTPRNCLHVLDVLLNLGSGVKPELVATDNALYSDMVFGLLKILGYNFSPWFRDLDEQRFRRATMPGVVTGTYGPLEDIARNRVNLNKVVTHWPDMLRVAGSLVTDQVRAYDLLRMFGREKRPTPLGQAFAEYGRIAETLRLPAVVDPVDGAYRCQVRPAAHRAGVLPQAGEGTCATTSAARSTRRTGRRVEDQLGALGLVLNAVVLWTTKYIDAAVAQLRAEGHEIRDEDIARLSPLKHKNLNVLGRYSFIASVPAAGARSLRDPDATGLDDDKGDDGAEE
ncbi:transposase [Streptomyces antibioticus]|uniref:transposase n=1 Tax=Streptomyces antibioticus TaxID=1890 RepID=UPI001FD8045C|nr:transposase [Streptomyces antibioticus]MCX4740918.1 transposase [Streptomyces antibioticus]MCX5173679.1 transposase [Streptomyces antibioticus]